MGESKCGVTEVLQLKAYELLLVTHLEPNNPYARTELIEWLLESPVHQLALRALSGYLEHARLLLANTSLASSSRH
ncbi:hypothetical protein N436_02570 [Pseudomonas sp. RV120224-01b]|nr:hypothetical protein N428_02899 [Pseudomonas sp. RV120224-01c]PYG82578.1 hypothetical protein N436_02570 [Pseudomonas sp. RV120224-01b]